MASTSRNSTAAITTTNATTMPAISKIAIVGCGTMGKAILTGLLESGLLVERNVAVTACVTSDESAAALRAQYGTGIQVYCGSNVAACREAQVVILCTKPQVAQSVLVEEDGMHEALEGKLLISLLAGVRIAQLQTWVPASTHVIRAMPNTPCRIREGMTVLSCRATVPSELRSFASTIFATLGRCRFLDEKHMDPVTALSGSGPAFACVVLESLADGGVMMGLPRDVAIELAAQALVGAARLVLATGNHPAMVKDSVTTPGGCTIAGLLTMEDGKIRSTLARTIQEASTVASTLGNRQDAGKK
ncbi:pyrroline-5-carboxylate reductase [Allomyces macrogynus ATCC 38327]|uniref:Pyrroline-5-carboxylate reductase n=1 Tax=Allomyces macrogynus (strain ATCC 38327) TaxID=578462 RepID=A0A0L0SH63_ALLM3|nr:pyrroline-5-carboxylate reductase [Allomyces macrogynus ATCC 38327]|eukprot:KNE61710.1 pyrroline-5-carboxylate reductase [Allomyces macrogynus ATCC 38327]